ncbi:ABC transporter ATP-binding protein [Corallococcus sp. BB11-1]|uniref:ABC transporter ATP-binding protein n=1 Tax=Corallococcus sp. BB11-1 TaxID=2996783 RepID=UPI00226FE645|nr:ABC transporter ATP-binding protein [Corallococcus sp. BB11-1]MCY1035808.1 ABC transporter ATP-binding protein [Corallococcus sp. BB11-1]
MTRSLPVLPVEAHAEGGIRVRGLAKRFGERLAVEGLTFDVRPGEVFGLLGPNGAGKTTTVRMLTGLLRPSEGQAEVWGHCVARDGEALRKVVGLLTEQPGLYDRLTARENLRFFMKLHEVDEATAWPRALHYLERFGLGGRENEPCGGFSKGMRQKLAIVRTLVHDPRVIFLDEPTSGLDPESARTVRDAVAELASEGRTIVLCSHNLAEVERLCERVAVVRRRLLALGPVRELRRAGQALDVRVEGDAEAFLPALSRLPFAPNVLLEGGRLRVMVADESQAPDVVACLVGAGARVHSVVPSQRPLEEVYLDLLKDEAV